MYRWFGRLGIALLLIGWVEAGPAEAFECPARIEEAKAALQKAEAAVDKAKAASRAAARGPLTRAKEILAHAEVEHRGPGDSVKKHAEAAREAWTAPGYAEEARIIAERF